MLLLTSVNDRLQVSLAAAGTVDVHTSWVDTTNAGVITPGRANTAITTTGLISVAGVPPATTQRNVKTIHVRNKHATDTAQVTISHTDGTNAETLFQAQLAAGRALQCTDQGGFRLLG